MNIAKAKVLFFVLVCMLLLTACSKSVNDDKTSLSNNTESPRAYMACLGLVCDDVFYYVHSNNIYKYMFSSQKESIEPSYVCTDVLCTHDNEECPLYMDYYVLVVDEYETMQNKNAPIIYSASGIRIKRYDGANNHTEIIKEYDDGIISSMWVCDDRIYMTYYYIEDKVTQLRCIDKDGRNEKIFSRENGDIICRIEGFDEKYLYYSDLAGDYYRVDRDLQEETFLFRVEGIDFPQLIVYDGYLYYADDAKIDTIGNTDFYSCSMYRINLSNIDTADPELLDDNILDAGCPMMFQSGNRILYNKCNPQKMGETEYVDYDGETRIQEVFNSGSNKMYSYNMDTGESEVLFEDMGANLTTFYYADQQYLLAGYAGYEFDEAGQYIEDYGIMLYDYINDKKQYIDIGY